MARQTTPVAVRVCEVVRTRTLDGRELGLTIYGLGRKIRFATPAEVPPFDGDLAWFEILPKAKTPLGVVFLRQVERPLHQTHWSR